MKVIAFEERYKFSAIAEEHQRQADTSTMDILKDAGYGGPDRQGEWPPGITDLGEGRIAAMDAAHVDVQILSHTVPGPETLEPSAAVELARQANDTAAAAVAEHPDRFRAFATLPMRDPAAAAVELERVVHDHGFVGALVNGHVDGRYLDDNFIWPVYESAEM